MRSGRHNAGLPRLGQPLDPATRNLLITVQLAFGVFPWLGKLAMVEFEPRAVLLWRLAAGTAVLGAFAAMRHGKAVWPGWRALPGLFLLSVLGITVNQLLFLEGLARSHATNAGLLMCVIPMATTGAALIAGQERPTTRRLLGIGLAVAGVAWMFMSRGAGLGGESALGDLLMTLNCVSYSLYLVLGKPVMARIPRAVVIAWMFAFGLATVPWFSLNVAWVPAAATATHWAALGGILAGPTVFAYLANAVVLNRTSASTTAVYVMLQPLIAAALGIGLLGERPSPSLFVTAVCVLGGLWLVSTPGQRARAAA